MDIHIAAGKFGTIFIRNSATIIPELKKHLEDHGLFERDLIEAKKVINALASKKGLDKTYCDPRLAQLLPCRLPPGNANATWMRTIGGVTLEIVPGTKLNEAGERVSTGFPSRTRPRLLMLFSHTQAAVTQRPEIDYGKPLEAFLKKMNLIADNKQRDLFLDQADKVIRAKMTLRDATGDRVVFKTESGEPAFLKDGYIGTFDPIYFQDFMSRALPLPEYAIKALSRSSKKLDCLAWLAATLPFLEKPLFVSWHDLSCQFGYTYFGAKAEANFRRDFKEVLKAVMLQYPAAKVELAPDDKGVILHPSETPVPPPAMVSGHRF